jgi:hypothetical protein
MTVSTFLAFFEIGGLERTELARHGRRLKPAGHRDPIPPPRRRSREQCRYSTFGVWSCYVSTSPAIVRVGGFRNAD